MARAVEPLVAADRVTVRYPDGTVGVREVDLAIGYHGFVCLRGPSGAGKSTILKLLAGEEVPSIGRLSLAGEDPRSWGWPQRLAWRRAVGYAGQDLALLEDRTALENVAYADQIRRGSDWRAAVAAAHVTLDRLALSEKAGDRPNELSGGERQRVVIAQATIAGPRLVLADEPTSNLDPTTAALVAAHLGACRAGGAAVVVATHHHPELFEALADQSLCADGGRVRQRGP